MNVIKSAIERQIVEIGDMLHALKEVDASEHLKAIIIEKLESGRRNLIQILEYL